MFKRTKQLGPLPAPLMKSSVTFCKARSPYCPWRDSLKFQQVFELGHFIGVRCRYELAALLSNHVMKICWMYSLIAVALALSLACNADDNLQVRQFLESFYTLPYDPKLEMTDVVLVNAFYTNEVQINRLSEEIVRKAARITNRLGFNDWLSAIFKASSMSNNANIQILRERWIDGFYRLDTAPPLQTFPSYEWNGGQFTNEHSFLLTHIIVAPNATNKLWTYFAVQPQVNHVTVATPERAPLSKDAFYLHLFGWPDLIRFNVVFQTVDMSMKREIASAGDEPDSFSRLKPDEARLAEVLSDRPTKLPFGKWRYDTPHGVGSDLARITLIAPDGKAHGMLQATFRQSMPEQRYLAYLRSPALPSSNIVALFAWDYDNRGGLRRFVRVERTLDQKWKAWAQNLVLVQKTTNVDWGLFRVDIEQFRSVFDKRPEFPVQTVDGKVVFNAKTDKYAQPVKPDHGFNLSKQVLVRLAMVCVFVISLFAFVIIIRKKRDIT